MDLSKDDYIIPILQDGIWSAISVILSTNQLTIINFNGKDQVCVDVEKVRLSYPVPGESQR